MEDRYEKLANSVAVDKTAAIVTSQDGCNNDIYIKTDHEKLDALRSQKRLYADKVYALKKEMKIRPGWGGSGRDKLPRHILNHPKYLHLMDLRCKLTELDLEINKLNKKLKVRGPTFENLFITMVKEKYPNIFKEIKKHVEEHVEEQRKKEQQ